MPDICSVSTVKSCSIIVVEVEDMIHEFCLSIWLPTEHELVLIMGFSLVASLATCLLARIVSRLRRLR